MKDYTNVYTIIFWLCLLSILVWVILKIIGVINTPPLIEWFPVIIAIFGAGVFYQDIINRFGRLENKTNNIENSITEMKKDTHNLDKRVSIIETKI